MIGEYNLHNNIQNWLMLKNKYIHLMSNNNKKLSIIIPVYNEKYTIQKILNKIYKLKNLKKEIIVVNDASTDGTKEILIKNKKK